MTDTRIREEKFTRCDYMALPEGFPAELIGGDFVKEPAPTRRHQRVLLEIAVRLRSVAGPSRVLVAPADVFIDECNVLQPDVLALSPDEAGDPDARTGSIPVLAVEVLSPSTAGRDRERKTELYLRAGVREVWLVDPDGGTVEVHTSGGSRRYAPEERALSEAVPGFSLAWRDLAEQC